MFGRTPGVCPQCGDLLAVHGSQISCMRCAQDRPPPEPPPVMLTVRMNNPLAAFERPAEHVFLERIAAALEASVEIQRRTMALLERAEAAVKDHGG